MEMLRYAYISMDGKYRYALARSWNADLPVLIWIMLNPSTADAYSDDPTISRCCGYSRAWGYGGILVLNLFAFRATKPIDLWRATDPIGPKNNEFIRNHLKTGQDILLAWGNVPLRAGGRVQEVLTALVGKESRCYCLGKTTQMQPLHPLYKAKNLVRLPYWETVLD